MPFLFIDNACCCIYLVLIVSFVGGVLMIVVDARCKCYASS